MTQPRDLLSKLKLSIADGELEHASSLLTALAAGSTAEKKQLLRAIPELRACAEAIRDETRCEILRQRRSNAADSAYRSVAHG